MHPPCVLFRVGAPERIVMKTKKLSVQFNVVVPVDVTHKEIRHGLKTYGFCSAVPGAGKDIIEPHIEITSIQVNDVEKKR